jgi:hypothetical protein
MMVRNCGMPGHLGVEFSDLASEQGALQHFSTSANQPRERVLAYQSFTDEGVATLLADDSKQCSPQQQRQRPLGDD